MATKYIACLGNGKDTAGKMYRKMEEIGRLLAENDCVVVTGGFGGSGMEAPAKGAKSVGGETWGFTMLGKPANPFIDKNIDCAKFYKLKDMNRAWSTEEQYGLRLGNLLFADGFIITDDDPTPGTLVEFCAILNMQKKFWTKQKPVAIMVSERGHLKLMELIINQFFPNNTFILATSSPEKAIGWVTA